MPCLPGRWQCIPLFVDIRHLARSSVSSLFLDFITDALFKFKLLILSLLNFQVASRRSQLPLSGSASDSGPSPGPPLPGRAGPGRPRPRRLGGPADSPRTGTETPGPPAAPAVP